jgi:Na+/melibiose symporter-like transporter
MERSAIDFRRVLGAEVVSNFGSMLSRLAIAWIATLSLGATAFEMGLLVVADVLAGAAGSLVLGALVDRSDKRAVMIATDLARAAVLGAVALLAARGTLAFWMLAAAAAATGLLTMAFELARSAWMARSVLHGDLPTRNAQLSAGTSLSETAAFALGGWIYQGLGAVLALVIDAASYLVSALFLRGVREPAAVERSAVEPLSRSALMREVREGLAAVAAHPTLRALAAVEILVELGMGLAGTSYMIYVARDLGFDPGAIGMIAAAGGLGALLGAGLAPRLGRRAGSARAMALGLLLVAAGTAFIPMAAGATLVGAALLVAHQVVGDGGYALRDVFDRTLRQTTAAPAMLARVDAGIRTAGQLATLAGALGGGALATVIGARVALGLAAALVGVAAVVAYLGLVRRHG